MPTTDSSVRAGSASSVAAGGWAALLEEEERYLAGHGFGAGVIVVSFVTELLRRVDDDGRALIESAILAILEGGLGWTERSAVLAPGRIGIVTVSVDDTLAVAARARRLHTYLRDRGLTVDVAYALRRERGGLAAAAARADAALDTSVARRQRTGTI